MVMWYFHITYAFTQLHNNIEAASLICALFPLLPSQLLTDNGQRDLILGVILIGGNHVTFRNHWFAKVGQDINLRFFYYSSAKLDIYQFCDCQIFIFGAGWLLLQTVRPKLDRCGTVCSRLCCCVRNSEDA